MLTIEPTTLAVSPGGIHCRFVDYVDFGVKVYRHAETRDSQFNNQTVLHGLGVAPRCWDCYEFNGPEGETYYAFYTEKVEIYNSAEYARIEREGEYGDHYEYYNRFDRARSQIVAILREYGLMWSDDHKGNFGIDCNGRGVIVDCDFITTIDDHGVSLDYIGCGRGRWNP